ncbi:MAG: hypothetical protein PHE54_04910 [Bacilli bacterium]|nr:hypothetical protein [Bacilli bacterium]
MLNIFHKINKKAANIKGGSLGKKGKTTWNDAEALEIAQQYIDMKMTIRAFAQTVGRPKSTVYEILLYVMNTREEYRDAIGLGLNKDIVIQLERLASEMSIHTR